MRQAGSALLGVLATVAALAACSADAQDAGPAPVTATADVVDVAAPGLAALRERAGIDPCPATDPSAPPRDDGLPSLTLPCLGGGRDVDLAHMRGDPLVVNLWAGWCGPCRKELPLFQQLHERAAERVAVIGVDFADDDPAAALGLAAASGVTYALLADPQAQLQAPLRVSGLPVTLFVAADGHVAYTKIGPISSYDELTDLVREHLGVTA